MCASHTKKAAGEAFLAGPGGLCYRQGELIHRSMTNKPQFGNKGEYE